MAVAVEPCCRRNAQRRSAGDMERHRGRQVMRGVMQTEAVAIAQPTVELRAQGKVLAAELARIRARRQRQWPAYRQSVAEFPGLAGKILFHDEVFRHVPALEIAAQDQLELDFALL